MSPPLTRSTLQRRNKLPAQPEIEVVVSDCHSAAPKRKHSDANEAVSETSLPEKRVILRMGPPPSLPPLEVPSNGPRAFNPMAPPPVPPIQLTLADRSRYARLLFYTKTNVWNVAREEVLVRFPNHAQRDRLIGRCCRLMYKNYANEPKTRLMSPLHKIRFVSRYYEYRFGLALRKSFANEEEYQRYMDVAMAGGAKECFVDMTQNNVVLQDQGRLMAKLQRQFSNWSSKVENLPKYLMSMQRKRRAKRANVEKSQEDPELLDALLHHSNTTLPEMRIRKMFRHLQVDEDLTWMFGRKIEFDSDELNRRFRVGRYLTEPTGENAKEDETVQQHLVASDGLKIEAQVTIDSLDSMPDTQNFWPESSSTQIMMAPEPLHDDPVSSRLTSSFNSTGNATDSASEMTVLQIVNDWDSSVEEVPFIPVAIDLTED